MFDELYKQWNRRWNKVRADLSVGSRFIFRLLAVRLSLKIRPVLISSSAIGNHVVIL